MVTNCGRETENRRFNSNVNLNLYYRRIVVCKKILQNKRWSLGNMRNNKKTCFQSGFPVTWKAFHDDDGDECVDCDGDDVNSVWMDMMMMTMMILMTME